MKTDEQIFDQTPKTGRSPSEWVLYLMKLAREEEDMFNLDHAKAVQNAFESGQKTQPTNLQVEARVTGSYALGKKEGRREMAKEIMNELRFNYLLEEYVIEMLEKKFGLR